MNKEVKKKWVEALRSGDYKQGLCTLRDKDDKFCCLGVLCDLHAKETGSAWQIIHSKNQYDGATTYLPVSVMAWAGLGSPEGSITLGPGNHNTLSRLNDTGSSFENIARFIEEYL